MLLCRRCCVEEMRDPRFGLSASLKVMDVAVRTQQTGSLLSVVSGDEQRFTAGKRTSLLTTKRTYLLAVYQGC
jgi:hypothetical protein